MKSNQYKLLIISTLSMLFLMSCQEKDIETLVPIDEAAVAVDKVSLGKLIFFDTSYSSTGRQACSSCHDPNTALVTHNIVAFRKGQ